MTQTPLCSISHCNIEEVLIRYRHLELLGSWDVHTMSTCTSTPGRADPE